jgi:hypothetical protein
VSFRCPSVSAKSPWFAGVHRCFTSGALQARLRSEIGSAAWKAFGACCQSLCSTLISQRSTICAAPVRNIVQSHAVSTESTSVRNNEAPPAFFPLISRSRLVVESALGTRRISSRSCRRWNRYRSSPRVPAEPSDIALQMHPAEARLIFRPAHFQHSSSRIKCRQAGGKDRVTWSHVRLPALRRPTMCWGRIEDE